MNYPLRWFAGGFVKSNESYEFRFSFTFFSVWFGGLQWQVGILGLGSGAMLSSPL